MEHLCANFICETIGHCQRLIKIAELGMEECDHAGCMAFYGLMLDSAYRVKTAAESRRLDLLAASPEVRERHALTSQIDLVR